jgi:hypothetical protein
VFELRVLWPSGELTTLEEVGAGQVLVVAEPG